MNSKLRRSAAALLLAGAMLMLLQTLIVRSPTTLTRSIELPNGGRVVAYELQRNSVSPGETINLDLYVDGPLPRPNSLTVELVGPGDAPLAEDVRAPALRELLPNDRRLRLLMEVRATPGTWKMRVAGGPAFGILRVR